MFNKKTSYEVNVQDITFWRKKINVDNTEVFVRECLNDPFMLYLDKVKGDNYLDWVTGRPFIMEDFGKEWSPDEKIVVNFSWDEDLANRTNDGIVPDWVIGRWENGR